MEEARYLHDCEECVFLGTYNQYDLYFCGANPTVIARYGTDGDYLSGLHFIPYEPALALAASRAIEAGLVTAERIREITNP